MNYRAHYSEPTACNTIALNVQPRSTLSLYLLWYAVPWKGLSYSAQHVDNKPAVKHRFGYAFVWRMTLDERNVKYNPHVK